MLRNVFKTNTEVFVRSCVETAPGSLLSDLGRVLTFLDASIMCTLGGWRGILRGDSARVTGHFQRSMGVFWSDPSSALRPRAKVLTQERVGMESCLLLDSDTVYTESRFLLCGL